MASSPINLKRPAGLLMIPALIRLTGWRFKNMGRFLFMCWTGMLAMVILLCIVPLFSRVALSTNIQNMIQSGNTTSPDVGVNVITEYANTDLIEQIQQELDRALRQGELGKYLGQTPAFSIMLPEIQLIEPVLDRATTFFINSAEPSVMAQQYTLIQGAWPEATGDNTIELAMLKNELDSAGLQIGSEIKIQLTTSADAPVWNARIVGVIEAKQNNLGLAYPIPEGPANYFPVAAFDPVLTLVNDLPEDIIGQNITKGQGPQPFSITLTYPFDYSRLDIDTLGALNSQTATLSWQLRNELANNVPGVMDAYPSGFIFWELNNVVTQMTFLQVGMILLLSLILILVLLLVSIQSNILVERQATVIATLRSRGATLRDIFTIFLFQALILALLALTLGPVLAFLLVQQITPLLLPDSQQMLAALNDQPIQVILGIFWYALAAVLVSLLVLILAINRAAKFDILTLRRESSRDKSRSFWRRIHLDWIFIILTIAGYIGYVYVQQIVIAAQKTDSSYARYLISGIGFIAPPFLFAACMMLFLRLFPLLLRLMAALVTSWRSAPAVLALEQISRQPRSAARIIVILALAISSSTFLLSLIETQRQYTVDAANFSVGADFSGPLPLLDAEEERTLEEWQQEYSSYGGVTSVTLGSKFTTTVSISDSASGNFAMHAPVQIIALDASTYADTATWCKPCSTQSLATLMEQLAQHRTDAQTQNLVYAIIDSSMAQRFGLAEDDTFKLATDDAKLRNIQFVVQAVIQNIPGVYGNAQAYFSEVGMMVDFESYRTVYEEINQREQITPDYVWLDTTDTVMTLEDQPTLTGRLALIERELQNAAYLNIAGVLGIGIIAALTLAMVGTLLASWVYAASRQVNFAVLRALGMAPRQVGAVLLWEQGLTYVLAFLLGCGLSAALITFTTPVISFLSLATTGSITSRSPYEVPPVQVEIPYPQIGLALAIFAIVCIVALLFMSSIVSRPRTAQILRLNED